MSANLEMPATNVGNANVARIVNRFDRYRALADLDLEEQ
jgi:hypothetical protein